MTYRHPCLHRRDWKDPKNSDTPSEHRARIETQTNFGHRFKHVPKKDFLQPKKNLLPPKQIQTDSIDDQACFKVLPKLKEYYS